MFATGRRSVVTVAAMLEVGIAGWWLGYGGLWLASMIAAVTLADCAFGIVRRRAPADLAGLELGAILVALLVYGDGGTLTPAVAAACLSWLIRPGRQDPLSRPPQLS
jgi:hypothetical protein